MCHIWGFHVIHLTSNSKETYGDENYTFGSEPEYIVLNREYAFMEFLRNIAIPNQEYLMLEPDIEFISEWPNLSENADVSLLYRQDAGPHISPSTRWCRKSSLSLFEEIWNIFPRTHWDWHGDSIAFDRLYLKIIKQQPISEFVKYNGVNIQFRTHENYMKPYHKYMKHYVAHRKLELLAKDEQK